MIDHVRANNKACIVKRKGGGLPDREFDSVRDAADWCRETGRSRARPKLVIASIATRVFCGFLPSQNEFLCHAQEASERRRATEATILGPYQ